MSGAADVVKIDAKVPVNPPQMLSWVVIGFWKRTKSYFREGATAATWVEAVCEVRNRLGDSTHMGTAIVDVIFVDKNGEIVFCVDASSPLSGPIGSAALASDLMEKFPAAVPTTARLSLAVAFISDLCTPGSPESTAMKQMDDGRTPEHFRLNVVELFRKYVADRAAAFTTAADEPEPTKE